MSRPFPSKSLHFLFQLFSSILVFYLFHVPILFLFFPFLFYVTAYCGHNEGGLEHSSCSYSCISCSKWCDYCMGFTSKESMVRTYFMSLSLLCFVLVSSNIYFPYVVINIYNHNRFFFIKFPFI